MTPLSILIAAGLMAASIAVLWGLQEEVDNSPEAVKKKKQRRYEKVLHKMLNDWRNKW